MAQKNQDQHRIKFLEDAVLGRKEQAPEVKKAEKQPNEEWKNIENQKPTRSNNNDAIGSRSSKSILTAGNGNITNFGGPSKQLKSQTSNSIWDSGIVEKLAGTKGNKEKTLEKKEEIEKYKNSMKADRLNEIVESLRETDTRKDATVSSAGVFDKAPGYKAPSRNISIFDNTSDFDRVPEQTHGEKVAAESRKAKEKDDSWKQVSTASKIKNTIDSIFDQLTKKENK